MDELTLPEISNRFDVNDIRIIRDYNSQCHAAMTSAEIADEVRTAAEKIIKEYNLQVTYAQKLR